MASKKSVKEPSARSGALSVTSKPAASSQPRVAAKKAGAVAKKAGTLAKKAAAGVKKALGVDSKGAAQKAALSQPSAKPAKPGKKLSGNALELTSAGAGAVRLDVGDTAPSFVLQDETGTLVSSESLSGSPYVLYFYPRDDTPGCTLQACGFRDSLPRFAAKGVRVLGVSPDAPDAHARFKKKHGLTFTLLSDPHKTLAKAYGVWVQKLNYGREYMGVERSTFVVDRRGTIRKLWRAVRVPGHVDTVLDAV